MKTVFHVKHNQFKSHIRPKNVLYEEIYKGYTIDQKRYKKTI